MKIINRSTAISGILLLSTVTAQAATDLESLLQLSLEELMDIEINSASKTSLTAGEIPASVIIITRQDIKRYGYHTLEEVLNNIPGMYMTEDWAWFGSVNYGVRGVYSKGHFDNMIVLVNGISQMEDGKRGYPLEKINVPVQAIDRVEVIRGPMSVIYGSSALLGAINIITNLPGKDDPENTVSVSRGTHDMQKAFARLSGKEGKFSFVFNAQKYSTDGPRHYYRELMSDTSILPTDWNLSEDARTVLGNESQYFDLSASFRNLNIYFSQINAQGNVIDSQPGVGGGSIAYTEASNLALDYTKIFNDRWQLKGKAMFVYNNYFLNEEYNFSGFYSNNQSNTEAEEYELNLLWTPNPSLQALFGAVRRSGKYRAYDDYPTFSLPNREILVPDNEDLQTNALFSQLKYQWLPNLNITAGIRAEWQEDYSLIVYDNNIDINNQNALQRSISYHHDISYTPQLAGIYDIDTNQHFKLIYSAGEKAPSPGNNISIIDLALPPLSSEKSRVLEASYILARPRLFLQIGIFHSKVKDFIITSSILENGSFVDALSNSGEINTTGFELTTTAQLSDAFNINFDISLHDVEDKTPGYENIDPAYAPSTIANIRATYSFSNDTHLSVLGHYVSSVLPEWLISDTGATAEERIRNGGRSGEEIEAYASYDANLVMQGVFAPNMDIGIKVGNLSDEEIRYPTINNRAFDKGTLGLGRYVLATLEYAF